METYKVLIADDDPDFTESLLHALPPHAEPHGIHFDVAKDGEECIRAAESLQPDLILLDLRLPVLDGYEVLAQLEKKKIVTRVMMMSGVATDMETAIRCVRAGACDYIVKGPFDNEALVQRIRRHLLLDNTTNFSTSDLSPLQQEIVCRATRLKEEAQRLEKEVEELRIKNRELVDEERQQKNRIINEVLQKSALVVIALVAVLVLWTLGFNKIGAQLAGVFVVLLLLLLIPADKIHSLTATVSKVFTARLDMNAPREGEKNDTR